MNNKIVVGNFKSYMTLGEVKNYIRIINKKIDSKNVILCPSNLYVSYFLDNDINIGLQNITSLPNCTGEITVEQAKSCGIYYSIVGHSERRINFGEDDITVNKKVINLLNNDLNIILCVGETEEEKNRLKTNSVLKRQIINCLRGVKDSQKIILAYEPVWAIGTNILPSNQEINSIVSYIKKLVKDLYNLDIRVLYGGSVNKDNIKSLNSIDRLDGFLVGKASTNANEFLEILEVVVNQ